MGFQDGKRIELGRNQYNHKFEGKIDDIRIYDRALNGEQIFALYEPNPTWSEYITDSTSDIEQNDVIRMLQDFDASNGVRFSKGEVGTNINADSSNYIHLKKSNNQTYCIVFGYF